MTPQNEAIAYRIWGYCKDRGWNDKVSDIAEALELPTPKVLAVVRAKGWNTRLAGVQTENNFRYDLRLAQDDVLDVLARQ